MSETLANVRPVKDRHGKIRYRFRRKGWPSAYLKGEPGTAEYYASYAALISLAYQYRSDLRYPPAPDSLERRLARIEAVLAKVEARAALAQARGGA